MERGWISSIKTNNTNVWHDDNLKTTFQESSDQQIVYDELFTLFNFDNHLR